MGVVVCRRWVGGEFGAPAAVGVMLRAVMCGWFDLRRRGGDGVGVRALCLMPG